MGVLNVIGVTAVLLLFFISMQMSEAGRVLHEHDEDENLTKKAVLPPGGPNPTTNVPGPATPTSGHTATINQRNFAGHTTRENLTKNKLFVLMESKQKGGQPPQGPNPPTNVPGPATPTSGHAATINQRNFAGHTTTENLTKNKLFVLMESKQKGGRPSQGPNGNTNVPGPKPPTSGYAATINQRNFAGHTTVENLTKNKLFVLMESKQKGDPPSGGHNPTTTTPGPKPPASGHAASTINQRN